MSDFIRDALYQSAVAARTERPPTDELLQALYDSEFHLTIRWVWDGGIEFAFDDVFRTAGFEYQNAGRNWTEAVDQICRAAVLEHPWSRFTVAYGHWFA